MARTSLNGLSGEKNLRFKWSATENVRLEDALPAWSPPDADLWGDRMS